MTIQVEFFGIARSRAGTSHAAVLPDRESATVQEILEALAQQFPDWATACLDAGRLRDGFIVSADGEQFVRDPRTVIFCHQSVLILSADAGG